MIRTLLVAALFVLPLPSMASAGNGNLNGLVRGTYAENSILHCLQSSTGFAGYAGQPNAYEYTVQVQALVRYNGDGTGNIISGTTTTIGMFGGPGRLGNGASGPLGFLNMTSLSGDTTYTVGPDRSIVLTPVNVTSTEIVGPNVNTPLGTKVLTGIRIQGYVSDDGRILSLSTAVPNPPQLAVETVTAGDGSVFKRVCSRTRTDTRIENGSRESASPFSRD